MNSFLEVENNDKQNLSEEIKSPIDFVKKTTDEVLALYEKRLRSLDFVDYLVIPIQDDYIRPKENVLIKELYGRTFLINYETYNSKEVLKVKMLANFIVKDAVTIRHIYNNKRGEKDKVYYSFTILSDDESEQSEIEVVDEVKNDSKKFMDNICRYGNKYQAVFGPKEFQTFVQRFIVPKLKRTVVIYENCGKIGPQKFLGADFLIDNNVIYRANCQNLIPTEDKNVFIKANDNRSFKLPTLIENSDKTAKMVANDFITNTSESWNNNGTLALLIIGHMIAGFYYDVFVHKIGVPVCIISGVSGCGKTTMVENGLSMFGLGDDFLAAGNSTAYGQMLLSQSINGLSIAIDDLSDDVISSSKFGENLKSLFKGIRRAKGGVYGKDDSGKSPCSQIIYSTNSTLPNIPELQNRANIISIMKNSLDTDKYHYLSEHKQNRKELSLILPELMKFDEDYVITLYESLSEYLKTNIKYNVMPRIINNIAYMWMGLTLLQEIADYTDENIKQDVINFANDVAEHFKAMPTPVDVLINGLLTLKNHSKITEGPFYRVKLVDDRIHLYFHKDTLIQAHNGFFKDSDRKIKRQIFDNYLKCDNRVIDLHRTCNFKGDRKTAVVLDITDNPDSWEFSGYQMPITPNDNSLSEIGKILDDFSK